MGWQLFVHAVRMVFNNLGDALKVSVVPYLISAVISAYFMTRFGNAMMEMQQGGMMMPPSGYFFWVFLLAVVNILMAIWIAVAWHRFILLEERPGGFIPAFHGANIGGYLWRSIVIGIMAGIVVMILAFVLGLLFHTIGMTGRGSGGAILMGLIIAAVLMIIVLRFSPALVGAAIGSEAGFGTAWRSTRNASGAILVLAIISAIANTVLQAPSQLGANPASTFSIAYNFVIYWVLMMIGISTITTLYGYYVEGRDLG